MSACKHYNTKGYRCAQRFDIPCHVCAAYAVEDYSDLFEPTDLNPDTLIGSHSGPNTAANRPTVDTVIPDSDCNHVWKETQQGDRPVCRFCNEMKDSDKPPLSHLLRFPNAIYGAARLLEHGAQKHGGFLAGKASTPTNETADSLLRHLTAVLNGEETDEDSGYPHRYHLLVNALFIAEMEV